MTKAAKVVKVGDSVSPQGTGFLEQLCNKCFQIMKINGTAKRE